MDDRTERRLGDALEEAADALVEALDADACAISRAVGDVLILVADSARDGVALPSGNGYLLSDYPETVRVVRDREPLAVVLGDERADPAEARVLEHLGFASVLMLPLVLRGEPWGLVEVYRLDARAFGAAEIRAATAILDGIA